MFGNKKDLEAVSQQLEAANATNIQLETRLNEALTTIESFASKEANYKKQVSAQKAEIAAIKKAHSTELQTLEASLAKKVNISLASIGVSQFANEQFTVNPNQSDQEILNRFLSLTGTEQTEYYQKNKAAIARVQLKQL